MKKLVCLLLVLVLVFALCACGEKPAAPKEPEIVTVELTEANFKEYFIVECDVSNLQTDVGEVLGYSFATATADLTVRCSRKVDCTPENVTVTIEVRTLDTDWEEVYEVVRLNVPVEGSAEKTVTVESQQTVGALADYLKAPNPYLTVTAAGGTVKVPAAE